MSRYELTFYKAIEELIELNLKLVQVLKHNTTYGYLTDRSSKTIEDIDKKLESLKKKFEVMGPP